MDASARALDTEGFCIVADVCTEPQCEALLSALPKASGAGSRRLLELPEIRAVVGHIRLHSRIGPLLPAGALAVQCSLFAKGSESNWAVAPHQDLSIPVAEMVSATECSGWSVKEGALFTQPPASVLGSLVAVRLQLDPGSASNGPLRVIRGSHALGRLSSEAVASLCATNQQVPCVVPRGGALLLKPLAVHASAKAHSSGARRVLHFLFGPPQLPLGLRWAVAI